MSHTAGPWHWDDNRLEPDVLDIYESHGGGSAPSSADARLIAVAPELLDVAKAIDVFQREYQTNTYDTLPGNDFYASKLMAIVMAARAAIAKAEAR